jgi:hypothetical protein
MSPTTRQAKQHAKTRARRRRTVQERLAHDRRQAQLAAAGFSKVGNGTGCTSVRSSLVRLSWHT